MQKITNFSRYTYDPVKDVVVNVSTNKARKFRGKQGKYRFINLIDDQNRLRTVSRKNIVADTVPTGAVLKRGRPRNSSVTKVVNPSVETTVSLPLSVCKDMISGKMSATELSTYLTLKCAPETVTSKTVSQVTLSKLIKRNLITVN